MLYNEIVLPDRNITEAELEQCGISITPSGSGMFEIKVDCSMASAASQEVGDNMVEVGATEIRLLPIEALYGIIAKSLDKQINNWMEDLFKNNIAFINNDGALQSVTGEPILFYPPFRVGLNSCLLKLAALPAEQTEGIGAKIRAWTGRR